MDATILQLIEDYLTERLNDRDRIKFEERLKNDDTFRKEFEFQKNIEVVLGDQQKNKLFDTVQTVENQYFKKKEPKILKIKRYLPYAAMIIAVLSLLAIGFNSMNKSTPDQLFAEYYAPYETYSKTRSTEKQTTSTFEDGLQFYELKQYDKALGVFDKLNTNDSTPAISFYSGICHLELNNHKKAITLLTPVANQQNNFRMQASWYLAMANLKNNKPTKAKQLLEDLAKKPGRYKQNAIEVLKQL